MKKRLVIVLMLAFSAVMFSCSKTRETENYEPSQSDSISATVTTTAGTTTTAAAAVTTTTTATTTTIFAEPTPTFSTSYVKLPDDFSQTKAEAIECFDITKFGEISEYDDFYMLALDGEYAYFEKVICDFDDDSDIYIYKFNINTGEVTQLDGYIPDYNTSIDDYAFINGRIIGFAESFTERYCFNIDTQQNCVEIIQNETIDWSKDSVRFVHPLNNDEYAVIWFDMGTIYQTYHIEVYDTDGNSREVITNKYNKHTDRYVYTVNDNKIYELVQTNELTDPYLNIYDTNGNLLSSTYLEEIAKAISEADSFEEYNDYVARIHAFGDCVAICVIGQVAGNDRYYIYNLSENTLTAIEDLGCYYVDTYKSIGAETENHIFYARNSDTESLAYNIYSLNNSGDITALADGAGYDIVSDGKTVVYFKDDILYKIVL